MPFLTSLNAVAVLPVSVMFLQGLQETIDYLACSGLQKKKLVLLGVVHLENMSLGQRITTSKKLLSNTSTFTPQKFAQLKSFFHGIKEKPSRLCSPNSTRTEGHEKYVRHFRLKSQFPLSPSLKGNFFTALLHKELKCPAS